MATPSSHRSYSGSLRMLRSIAGAVLLGCVCHARAQAPPETPAMRLSAMYNAATQAFAQGKWRDAAQGFEDVLKLSAEQEVPQTQFGPAYYTLGAAYFNVPDYPKAAETFRKYLAKFPAGEKVLAVKLALARSYFFDKQYADALGAFAAVETVPVFRDQALLSEAECCKELSKADDQIRVLERLIGNGLNTAAQASGALTLIELYGSGNQPDKAMTLIEAMTARLALVENAIAFNSAVVKMADALAEKRVFAQALDAYRSVRSRDEVVRLQEERVAEMSLRLRGNLKAAAGNPAALAEAVQENARVKAQQDVAAALLADFKKLPDYGPSILIREAKTWYNWDKKWESVTVLNRLLKKYPQAKEREAGLFSMLVAYADLNQAARSQELCKQYLGEFKDGSNAPTVGYLLGATALQANDPKGVETYFAGAELDRQLESLAKDANATANARLQYARAELASLRKKPDEHDALLAGIAQKFKPDELGAVLLAQVGDGLLVRNDTEHAASFYGELKEFYPKSGYVDYAYVGLGEIAYAKKDYQTALPLFTEAANVLAASKVKEATLGEAKTLLELNRCDEARKLFEQVASVREWRGESTAYAIYSLGPLETRQGRWEQAAEDYQRVIVLHQRYLPWVAKAYVAGAANDDKMGRRPEAIKRLKAMLQNEKLRDFPEVQEARQMLAQWGAAA